MTVKSLVRRGRPHPQLLRHLINQTDWGNWDRLLPLALEACLNPYRSFLKKSDGSAAPALLFAWSSLAMGFQYLARVQEAAEGEEVFPQPPEPIPWEVLSPLRWQKAAGSRFAREDFPGFLKQKTPARKDAGNWRLAPLAGPGEPFKDWPENLNREDWPWPLAAAWFSWLNRLSGAPGSDTPAPDPVVYRRPSSLAQNCRLYPSEAGGPGGEKQDFPCLGFLIAAGGCDPALDDWRKLAALFIPFTEEGRSGMGGTGWEASFFLNLALRAGGSAWWRSDHSLVIYLKGRLPPGP